MQLSELSGVNPGKTVDGGRVWAPVVADDSSVVVLDKNFKRDLYITFVHIIVLMVPPIIYSLVFKSTGKTFYGNGADFLNVIMYLVFGFSFVSLLGHLVAQAVKFDYKIWWQGVIRVFVFITGTLAILVVAFFMAAQPFAVKVVNNDFSQWAQTNYSVSLKSPDEKLDSTENVEFLDRNNKTVLYDLVPDKGTGGVLLEKTAAK